jgi:pilus assembly protein TadC
MYVRLDLFSVVYISIALYASSILSRTLYLLWQKKFAAIEIESTLCIYVLLFFVGALVLLVERWMYRNLGEIMDEPIDPSRLPRNVYEDVESSGEKPHAD